MRTFLFAATCAALLAQAGMATAQEGVVANPPDVNGAVVANPPDVNSAATPAAVTDSPPGATTPAPVATAKPKKKKQQEAKQVPAGTHPSTGSVVELTYMKIQDLGFIESLGR
jgi:hypothetical protein